MDQLSKEETVKRMYRLTHQVVPKVLVQGRNGCYIGPDSRVGEQPDVSPCRNVMSDLSQSGVKLSGPECTVFANVSRTVARRRRSSFITFGGVKKRSGVELQRRG